MPISIEKTITSQLEDEIKLAEYIVDGINEDIANLISESILDFVPEEWLALSQSEEIEEEVVRNLPPEKHSPTPPPIASFPMKPPVPPPPEPKDSE